MGGSLDKLAAIGLRNVEAFDFVSRPTQVRAALDASGLASPTGHAPLLSDTLWTPDGEIPTPAPEVVFAAAAEIGMTTVIDPFVAPERWLTADGVADIADRLKPRRREGGGVRPQRRLPQPRPGVRRLLRRRHRLRALRRADRRARPARARPLLALTGGQDVPALVSALGDRLVAVHVKDGVVPASNPWAPGAGSFGSDSLDQRHAGTADVPLAEALKAGTAIRYAVIEYDKAPGDVFEDIAASYAFLRDGGYVQ